MGDEMGRIRHEMGWLAEKPQAKVGFGPWPQCRGRLARGRVRLKIALACAS